MKLAAQFLYTSCCADCSSVETNDSVSDQRKLRDRMPPTLITNSNTHTEDMGKRSEKKEGEEVEVNHGGKEI